MNTPHKKKRPPRFYFVDDDPAALWRKGDTGDDLGPEYPGSSARLLRVDALDELLVLEEPYARGLIERLGGETADVASSGETVGATTIDEDVAPGPVSTDPAGGPAGEESGPSHSTADAGLAQAPAPSSPEAAPLSNTSQAFYEGWSREQLLAKIFELQRMLRSQQAEVSAAYENGRKLGYEQGSADGYDNAIRDMGER